MGRKKRSRLVRQAQTFRGPLRPPSRYFAPFLASTYADQPAVQAAICDAEDQWVATSRNALIRAGNSRGAGAPRGPRKEGARPWPELVAIVHAVMANPNRHCCADKVNASEICRRLSARGSLRRESPWRKYEHNVVKAQYGRARKESERDAAKSANEMDRYWEYLKAAVESALQRNGLLPQPSKGLPPPKR
jgi:hypothetical protein